MKDIELFAPEFEHNTKIPDYFWADRLTPVKYFGYTSSVRMRVFEIDVYNKRGKEKEVIQRFNDLKQKCMDMFVDMRSSDSTEPLWSSNVWDNKIVIECLTETGETIFVGYYDFNYSIGKAIYSRDGRIGRPYCVNPSNSKEGRAE